MMTSPPPHRLLAAMLLGIAVLASCRSHEAQTATPATVATSVSPGHILSAAETQRLKDLLPGPFPQRPGATPAQTLALDQQLSDAEVQLIRAVQDDTSAQARARADRVESSDPMWDFATVMGPHFNPFECPKIAAAMAAAEKEVAEIKDFDKKKFLRARPPGSNIATDDSYPSGHCTRAWFRTRMLGALAPEKKDELMRAGRAMALNRMIAGKHHPSDCVAGIVLGGAIADAMLAAAGDSQSAFHVEWEAAMREWREVNAPKAGAK